MAEKSERLTDAQITHLYDPVKFYNAAVSGAGSRESLAKRIDTFRLIASDALDAVNSPDFDWKEFKAGLRKERKGIFAGDDWARKYSMIPLPYLMLLVSTIALRYKAPWGCVYIRMRDVKRITVSNGIAHVNDTQNTQE